MTNVSSFPWQRILVWGLVLGILVSIFADWGAWESFPAHTLYRVLIVIAGGVTGWLLNVLAGNYVGMGTHVIESMGVFKFSDDTPKKIENGFIFTCALVAAILSVFFVK
jgi:hypothetical protein